MWFKQMFFWAPLFTFFLFANNFHFHDGTINAKSRYLTMVAMVADHSFKIDPYIKYTEDWAKTPDGHYYSNKAPGPMFLGFPILWYYAKTRHFASQNLGHELIEHYDKYIKKISLWVQGSLVIFLSILVSIYMKGKQLSLNAVLFFLISICFATVPSLFLNSYFGHSPCAVFTCLAFVYSLKKNLSLSALCLGMALLCDYSVVFVIPSFLYMWFMQNEPLKLKIASILKGGVLPGILWVWYHLACFSNPWSIANKYQNPIWVDHNLQKQGGLWGIFDSSPHLNIIYELTFGSLRGIFVVQPAVFSFFILIGVQIFNKNTYTRDELKNSLAILCGFIMLLMMNSAFNGWHGGSTPGPRYLSAILMCIPLVQALAWDRLSRINLSLCVVLSFVSVFYWALVQSKTMLIEVIPLWPFYLKGLHFGSSRTDHIAIFMTSIILIIAFYQIPRIKSFFHEDKIENPLQDH